VAANSNLGELTKRSFSAPPRDWQVVRWYYKKIAKLAGFRRICETGGQIDASDKPVASNVISESSLAPPQAA